MKAAWKYFKHELKKNVRSLLIFTVICTVFYIIVTSSMDLINIWEDVNGKGHIVMRSTNIGVVFFMLALLCIVAPAIAYSFKTDKRSIDVYYSMPLKKWKLYFVKTLVGLLLAFVPFTVAYFGGFFVVLSRFSDLAEFALVHKSMYIVAYFGGLLFGLCMYGVNAFVFTRANKVGDGIAYIFAYALLPHLLITFFFAITPYKTDYVITQNFAPWGTLISFCENMDLLIRGKTAEWSAWTFVLPSSLGVVAYFLLFFNLRFEKAENAEQVNESWFGYKLFIPLYTILLCGVIGREFFDSPLVICLIVISAVVVTMAWRRRIRFSWKYWLVIFAAVLVGIALNELANILFV